MITALNPNTVIRAISLVTCVLCALVVAVLAPSSTATFWKASGWVVLLVTLAAFVLTFPGAYGRAHRLFHADAWGFPLLDGEWTTTASSNWPRIAALQAAARHDSPPFDTLSDAVPIGGQTGEIKFKTTITSSLFDIRLVSRMSPTRTSRSVFVRPEKLGNRDPELYYIYEQTEAGPVEVSDSKRHFGAAHLRYDRETQTLQGDYWTERRSEAGLNTSGTIIMTRTSA